MTVKKLGPYFITDSIGVSGSYVLCRAKLENSEDVFLIKLLKQGKSTIDSSAQLQHEHYLLGNLNKNSSFFPKVIDFIEGSEQYGLVFKDEGFIAWHEAFAHQHITVDIFFPAAIQLAKIVVQIHAKGIIHKNLNPYSVLYHPDKKLLQVSDFSIATELKRTLVPGDPPRLLQGQLEYIAPEQTGRMNRALTQRADLYSMGILFYEWLTGAVPFSAKEPMTIIFGHIATIPKAPHLINPTIPEVLSKMVMKLLSKMGENRYKSAFGLALDLENAYRQWQQKAQIDLFNLGEDDLSTQLELPDRLYGRDAEVEILLEAFDEMVQSQKNNVVMVSGYSGVGKTALVRELIPKIAVEKGFFAAGKFDKFQQSDTYEGLRAALDKLVRYHLSLPEVEYQEFKDDLFEEMGSILSVVTDFIPRLKTIVGEQKPLPMVGVEQTKNRFELGIHRFIKLASKKRPLLLFLDDMQWANHSMFDLLEKIVVSENIQNVLVVMSYRSNEIDFHHPLKGFVEKVNPLKKVCNIFIEGLSQEALTQLFENMLYLPRVELESLVQLMSKKTEGNPFFIFMLLEELYREKQLYFSVDQKRWVWNEDKLMEISASDNVVDFVTRRLLRFMPETKEILNLAACIGSSFSLEELTLAQESTALFLANALQPALQEGLIIPTQLQHEWLRGVSEQELLKREYRFQHDKIQQSCYELNPIEETKHQHLKLARKWYAAYREQLTSTRLMAIADQFDKGLTYVSDAQEKRLIEELNHKAGEVALQSAAYEVAYNYNRIAQEMLDSELWRKDHDFCFKVNLSYLKSAFLSRHFIEASAATEIGLSKASGAIEKAHVLKLKGDLNRAVNAPEGGMAFYEQGLKLLGYSSIAHGPNSFTLLMSAIRFKLKLLYQRKPLESLPEEEDERQILSFSLALHLAEEAYYRGHIVRYAYIIMLWAALTFSHHNRALRSTMYIINAILFPRSFFAHKLYLEASNNFQKIKSSDLGASFYFAGSLLHASWHTPWLEVSNYFKSSVEVCEKAGALEFLALSGLYEIWFDTHLTISEILVKIKELQAYAKNISPRLSNALSVIIRYHENLMGVCAYDSWQDELFSEKVLMSYFKENNYQVGINFIHIKKLQSAVHLYHINAFKDNILAVKKVFEVVTRSNSATNMSSAYLYLFLAEVELYPNLSFIEKINTRRRLKKLYQAVKSWVQFCPENFEPMEILMQAEYAKLQGDSQKAVRLYGEVMRLGRECHFLEVVGLAAQGLLRLAIQEQKTEQAKTYLDNALSVYEEWRALGVVEALKKQYAHLLTVEVSVKKTPKSIQIDMKKKEEEQAQYFLDARSVMLAAEVIGKEIQLGGLLGNVMQLLVENIGATRSALCLMQKGTLWVEGFYDSEDEKIHTLTHQHWEEANICQEVILQTWREGREVLLMDVNAENEWSGEDYFKASGTQCVISVPIFKADKVMGIIYCENKLSTNAFNADRVDILRALSIQMSISVENSRLYTIFEKFVSKPFLNQLGQEHIFDIERGDSVEKHMNVLFMDIRNFTQFSEKQNANETFHFINEYLAEVAPVIHEYNGFIDKFLGDGIMALFPTRSDEALRACIEMQRRVKKFAEKKNKLLTLDVGMGLHYGPLMLGIVGESQHIEGTVIGDTVNIASRLETFNKVYHTQCLISDNVKKRLLKAEDYHLRQVGQVRLLGRQEAVAVWQVLDVIADESHKESYIESIPLFSESYQQYLNREFTAAKKGFERLLKDNPTDAVVLFYLEQAHLYEITPPLEDWHGEVEMKLK